MTPLLTCTGDIHLDEFIWRRFKFITGDSFLGFDAAIDTAVKSNTPLVCVGDIFDCTTPSSEIVEQYRKRMDYCASKGVKVYAIQGNHDKTTPPWYTSLHPHPIHFGDGNPIVINGLNCIGLDYAVQDDIQKAIAALPKKPIDVLFLHQAAKQALGFEGAWNCDLEWVPANVRLVVLGDIHTTQSFDLGSCKATYTGPGHARDINQVGKAHCLSVADDLSFSHIKLPERYIKQATCTDLTELAAAKAWLTDVTLKANQLRPFLWLYVSPTMLVEANSLLDLFPSAFIQLTPLTEDGDTSAIADILAADVSPSAGMSELLAKILNSPDDKDAYDLTKTLLTDETHMADIIRVRFEKHLQGEPQ